MIVRESQIRGLGLFANAPLERGEIVAVLGGTTITNEEVNQIINSGKLYDGVVLARNLNLSIVPEDWPGIFGNDSCAPNLWMKDEVIIISSGEIRVGEELTTDYETYTISPYSSMVCKCESVLCRRVIRGNDWKLLELQRRYEGHFSPIIVKLIEEEAYYQRPAR